MPVPQQDSFYALTSRSVALDLIRETFAVEPDAFVLALVENRPAGVGLALPIEGPDPGPDGLLRFTGVLREAMADEPGSRLVLATRRPGGTAAVAESDLECWRHLQAAHAGHSLELLEWFVLTGETTVHSMAELSGSPPAW